MSYSVEMAPEAESSLLELDKPVRRRIKKKIDEISDRLEKWDMDPDGAVEKRLRGPFNFFIEKSPSQF